MAHESGTEVRSKIATRCAHWRPAAATPSFALRMAAVVCQFKWRWNLHQVRLASTSCPARLRREKYSSEKGRLTIIACGEFSVSETLKSLPASRGICMRENICLFPRYPGRRRLACFRPI